MTEIHKEEEKAKEEKLKEDLERKVKVEEIYKRQRRALKKEYGIEDDEEGEDKQLLPDLPRKSTVHARRVTILDIK